MARMPDSISNSNPPAPGILSASSSAPLGQRTFRELFLCAVTTWLRMLIFGRTTTGSRDTPKLPLSFQSCAEVLLGLAVFPSMLTCLNYRTSLSADGWKQGKSSEQLSIRDRSGSFPFLFQILLRVRIFLSVFSGGVAGRMLDESITGIPDSE